MLTDEPAVDASRPSGGLGGKTATASLWVGAARILMRASDLLLLVVLARFLVPEDFGVVTLAASVVAVVGSLTLFPVTIPLVRLERPEKVDIDTAFTLKLLRALVIAVLGVLAALVMPFVYDDARLVPIVLVLTTAEMARSMNSPTLALLFKQLKFRPSFIMDASGKFTGVAVAIALAMATESYWAIVAGTVSTAFVTCAVSYWLAPYRPGLSLARARYFWDFLRWLAFAEIVSAIGSQFDRLFLGAYIATATLGLYGVALHIANIILQAITTSIVRPLISSFVLVKDDPERLRGAYHKVDSAVVTVTAPTLVGLYLMAGPLVTGVLSPDWHGIVPILEWLSLALIPKVFRLPFRPLAMALGRSDLVFAMTSLTAVTRVAAVVVGYFAGGLFGVIAALGIHGIAAALVLMVFVRKLTDLPIIDQITVAWRPGAACLVMAIAAFALLPLISEMEGLLGLVALVALSGMLAVLYAATVFALWWVGGRPGGIEAFAIEKGSRMVRRLRPRDA